MHSRDSASRPPSDSVTVVADSARQPEGRRRAMVGQRRRSRRTAISRVMRPTRPSSLWWRSSPWPAVERRRARPTPPASAPAASSPRLRRPPAGGGDRQGLRGVRDRDRGAMGRGDPSALEDEKAAGRVDYSFQDAIGYSGDMERVLREVAGGEQPAIVFGGRVRQRGSGTPRGGRVSISRSYSARAVVQPSPTTPSSTTGSMSRRIWPACLRAV